MHKMFYESMTLPKQNRPMFLGLVQQHSARTPPPPVSSFERAGILSFEQMNDERPKMYIKPHGLSRKPEQGTLN